MIANTKTVTTKVSMTAAGLEAALNRALQAHPECEGFRVLKLMVLEKRQGLANWDAEFSTPSGATMSADCKRVLIGVKHALQKHFDLDGAG
jgi:hypothetical protein